MTGRVTLVTGAGRGLGRVTALTLAARGDRVMAVALEEDELAALAEEASIKYLCDSIATDAGRARIVEETRSRLGPIDILIANAGVSYAQLQVPKLPIWHADSEVWRTMIATNLDAAFDLIRLSTADMIDSRWGRIVVVGSTTGQIGVPAAAAYSASKQGLLGLIRSVAQDVAPFNVTCNAVLPGFMRTKPTEYSAQIEANTRGVTVDEVWAERGALYAAGRVVEPSEVANAISFLSSAEGSGINGEAIRVALGGVL